jgi:hypothetical protein
LKWQQYRELFGTSSDRVELLRLSAPALFGIIQHALWEDTLLHLSRLTDRPEAAGKHTLSIRRLPALIPDDTLRLEVATLVDAALSKVAFARDQRNHHLVQSDLQLALGLPTPTLMEASRPRSRRRLRLSLNP